MFRTSRAGSHAGRGFRFQDAIGVWLAVRSWTQELPYGEVIPEGRDDYELRGREKSALVQVKSRRSHLGLFPISDVAEFIRALWARAESCTSMCDDFILILECAITGGPAVDHTLNDHSGLAKVLCNDSRWSIYASRTQVWFISTPYETAIASISDKMPCTPLAAQVYYGELLSQISGLADANGLVKEGSFKGLTISDVEKSIRRLEPSLDMAGMEAALRDGYCDAIDFLTSIDDATFYQGVDTRPGHLAAGLVIERPEACHDVLSILDSHGAALIVGPSGAGKSALMWEAARATRHTIRWFEVKKGNFEYSHLFVRLARSLRASSSAPIGFVLDDVGRGFSGLWDGLVKEATIESGILLLGSVREEDLFMLSSRAQTREIRPVMNGAIAERVWKQLKDQQRTSWAGWREPWILSGKLLLEFAHILTRGDRLEIILGEQIDRRLREGRDTELSILRITALAGAAGATLDVERLVHVLNITPHDLTRALRRLIDEHLIAEPISGRLKGLHQLRSTVLFNLCHAYPPPMLSRTVNEAICVAIETSLEKLAVYVTVQYPMVVDSLLQSLAARLEQDHDPIVASAIFSGLGQAHIEITLKQWVPEAFLLGLEPTQITSAVIFAIAGTDISSSPLPERLKRASGLLQTRSASDPRLSLISLLPQSTISECIINATATQLRTLLNSWVGIEIPEKIRYALSMASPDFDSLALGGVATLLGTVQLIDPMIAKAWTNGRIEHLLSRVPAEIPWASSVQVEIAPEGRLLRGSIFNVAPSVQSNVHEEVIQLCDSLFGLDPTAEVVAVDAIAADGLPSGFQDYQLATKRIPRENMPPSALPEWNRRWTAAAAWLVGSESYSDYLQRAFSLLEQLVPLLERIVDNTLRGKVLPPIVLERFGNIYNASCALTPPREGLITMSEPKYFNTPLQNLLFDCSADLIRRFIQLPDQYGAFVMWSTDLLKRIHQTREEPWDLIDKTPEAHLQSLERIIDLLRLLAIEAGMKNAKPFDMFKLRLRSADRGNALRIAKMLVEETLRQRSAKYLRDVKAELLNKEIRIELYTRPDWKNLLPWPNLELLAIVDVESPIDWQIWLLEQMDLVRDAIGEMRCISIVPRIGGLIVSRLTVSGVATLFPSSYALDDWLDTLNLRRLNDTFSRAAQLIIDSIIELDGLRQFDLGVQGRPAIERVVREAVETELSQALVRFEELAEGNVIQLLPRQLSEEVSTRKIALAEGIAAWTHGQWTSSFEVLIGLQTVILIEDLHANAANF